MVTFPEPQNLTGIPEMIRYANTVSDNVFVPLLLMSLYIIIFLYTKHKQMMAISSAAAAGFMTAIVAMILGLMGIVDQPTILTTIFAVVVPVILLYSYGK